MARTYEQLGYISESAVWRNLYLTAAAELRHGPPKRENDHSYEIDMLTHAPIESFLDAMAAALNSPTDVKDTLFSSDFKDHRQQNRSGQIFLSV